MVTRSSLIYELHIRLTSKEEQEMISAFLEYLDAEAIEENNDGLVLYHDQEDVLINTERQLLELVPWLKKEAISYKQRPNINWNELWEANFRPITIGDFCTVLASFHEVEDKTQYRITIDPEMAFGTGHHETTYLMIKMMEGINFSGKNVMDYGTGTGILAILAEKLGAANIFAFDYDEIATECALKCVTLNNCHLIKCATARIEELPVDHRYDVVLANINRNVLLESVYEISKRQTSSADLLLSGILRQDRDHVLSAYTDARFLLKRELSKGDWVCLHLNKSNSVPNTTE